MHPIKKCSVMDAKFLNKPRVKTCLQVDMIYLMGTLKSNNMRQVEIEKEPCLFFLIFHSIITYRGEWVQLLLETTWNIHWIVPMWDQLKFRKHSFFSFPISWLDHFVTYIKTGRLSFWESTDTFTFMHEEWWYRMNSVSFASFLDVGRSLLLRCYSCGWHFNF